MKNLLRIAVGVAVAGYLVNLLLKKRSEQRFDDGVGVGASAPDTSNTPAIAEDGDSQRDWTPQESATRE